MKCNPKYNIFCAKINTKTNICVENIFGENVGHKKRVNQSTIDCEMSEKNC